MQTHAQAVSHVGSEMQMETERLRMMLDEQQVFHVLTLAIHPLHVL